MVPKALRPLFDGRSEIKRSLHTRNVRVALVQARQMSLAAYQLFDLVKSSMTGKIDINDPSTFTSENVRGKFEYTVEEDLNTGKRITRIKTDPSSPDSIAAGRAVAMAIETKKQLLMGKVETENPEAMEADERLRRELAEIIGASQPKAAVVAATLPVAPSSGDEYIPAVPRKTVLDTTKLTPKDRARMLQAYGVHTQSKRPNQTGQRAERPKNTRRSSVFSSTGLVIVRFIGSPSKITRPLKTGC